MSNLVLGFFVVAFLVVSFIPLRVIICLGLLGKWKKGSTWYERRYKGNLECARIEIRNYFYNEKTYSSSALEESEEWYERQWPKDKFKPMQLKKKFQINFDVLLPDDFETIFKTPKALCEEMAFVDAIFTIDKNEPYNSWDLRYNEKLFQPDINPILYVKNFIENYIASEVYRYNNP